MDGAKGGMEKDGCWQRGNTGKFECSAAVYPRSQVQVTSLSQKKHSRNSNGQ